MAKLDLKLANGRLATTAGVHEVDIGIKAGKIAAIGEWGDLPDAEEVVDIANRVVMPGGIDTHVHAGDPGGFDSTNTFMAAALGGVTTIVDMPMQLPSTTDPETLDVKLDAIAPKAIVDFALWATCGPQGTDVIEPLRDKGVVGFKLVMQRSVEGIMPLHRDGELLEALPRITGAGLQTSVHAESQDMIVHLEEKLRREGRTDPRAFLDCHPVITELEAIHRLLFIAEQTKSRVHVAHCSIAEGIDLVEQARNRGLRVSVETCPHYLVLDESIFDTRGVLAKLSPALRDRKQVELLWQRLRYGKIDNVASDHVPYPLTFKQGDIWEAAAGIPGIQTMFPILVYEGIKKGRISLPQLVRVMSEGPARVAGLYPRKGSALIGADADFAVFDLERERTVELDEQVGVEWTLYQGMTVVYPDLVLLRGKPVVDGGKVVGDRGYGELCPPVPPDDAGDMLA
jgi:allantoinase